MSFRDPKRVFDVSQIVPSQKERLCISLDETTVYDKLIAIPFHRKQALFEINDENGRLD